MKEILELENILKEKNEKNELKQKDLEEKEKRRIRKKINSK